MAKRTKTPKIQEIGEVKIWNEKLRVLVSRYPAGGQVFVGLEVKETGEPYTDLSTNMRAHGAEVADDEVVVKTWSENEHVIKPMLEAGFFEDTGKRVPAGYAEAQIWRFKSPAHVPAL